MQLAQELDAMAQWPALRWMGLGSLLGSMGPPFATVPVAAPRFGACPIADHFEDTL